jgi:hypothetical protein
MSKKRQKIKQDDLEGFKYFKMIAKLLENLHDVGTERDRAGNRDLHMDQYCSLVLLFLFNPIVSSLRAIQQASELRKVQKMLGCKRASLGSLSESVQIFDPERLKPIIEQLGEKLEPVGRVQAFKDVPGNITLVDGSLVKVLPWLSQAMLQKPTDKNEVRMHTFFEVDRYVPSKIITTGGTARGEDAERSVVEANLEKDRCYVMDRGYAKFALFNAINDIDSSYVCRIRDNSSYGIAESRPLSEEDTEANVIEDSIVNIGTGKAEGQRPDHPLRIVTIRTELHEKRSRRTGNQSGGPLSDGVLRIATNLLDIPSHIVAMIYRHRWTIETFFNFLKHILGCRHLISTQQNGIDIQLYMAIIACMLISLWTGRKPTKRTYEMVCYYFIGMASLEELESHIAKLQKQDDSKNCS